MRNHESENSSQNLRRPVSGWRLAVAIFWRAGAILLGIFLLFALGIYVLIYVGTQPHTHTKVTLSDDVELEFLIQSDWDAGDILLVQRTGDRSTRRYVGGHDRGEPLNI